MFIALGISVMASALSVPAVAQSVLENGNGGAVTALNFQRDIYINRMVSLMEDLKRTGTIEQRKEISKQMRQASAEYRLANPPKALTPIEIEARRQKVEEMLKRDPFQWEIYQLHQARMGAATLEERQSYDVRIHALIFKHAADEEAKLTTEQRADLQVGRAKNIEMRSELNPLLKRLHEARASGERKVIHTQILQILERYR